MVTPAETDWTAAANLFLGPAPERSPPKTFGQAIRRQAEERYGRPWGSPLTDEEKAVAEQRHQELRKKRLGTRQRRAENVDWTAAANALLGPESVQTKAPQREIDWTAAANALLGPVAPPAVRAPTKQPVPAPPTEQGVPKRLDEPQPARPTPAPVSKDKAETYGKIAETFSGMPPYGIVEYAIASDIDPRDRAAFIELYRNQLAQDQTMRKAGYIGRFETTVAQGGIDFAMPLAKLASRRLEPLLPILPKKLASWARMGLVPKLDPDQERFRQELIAVREIEDPTIRPETPRFGRKAQQAARMAVPMFESIVLARILGAGVAAYGATPAVAGIATRAGAAASFLPQIADQTYSELIGEGIDPKIATIVTVVSAPFEAAMESIIPDPFAKYGGAARGTAGQVAGKFVRQFAIRFGLELSEEGFQGGIRQAAVEFAKFLDKNIPNTPFGDAFRNIVRRGVGDVLESAEPLGMIMAPGGAVQAVGTVAESAQRAKRLGALREMRAGREGPGPVGPEGPVPVVPEPPGPTPTPYAEQALQERAAESIMMGKGEPHVTTRYEDQLQTGPGEAQVRGREDQGYRPTENRPGDLGAARTWLEAVERGDRQAIRDATQKLLGPYEARGLPRPTVPYGPYHEGAEVRAQISRGEETGPTAEAERARPSPERGQFGQPTGEFGRNVQQESLQVPQQLTSGPVGEALLLLQELRDPEAQALGARALHRMLSEAGPEEQVFLVDQIRRQANALTISTSETLDVSGRPRVAPGPVQGAEPGGRQGVRGGGPEARGVQEPAGKEEAPPVREHLGAIKKRLRQRAQSELGGKEPWEITLDDFIMAMGNPELAKLHINRARTAGLATAREASVRNFFKNVREYAKSVSQDLGETSMEDLVDEAERDWFNERYGEAVEKSERVLSMLHGEWKASLASGGGVNVELATALHREFIQQALAAGKPVSDAILAEHFIDRPQPAGKEEAKAEAPQVTPSPEDLGSMSMADLRKTAVVEGVNTKGLGRQTKVKLAEAIRADRAAKAEVGQQPAAEAARPLAERVAAAKERLAQPAPAGEVDPLAQVLGVTKATKDVAKTASTLRTLYDRGPEGWDYPTIADAMDAIKKAFNQDEVREIGRQFGIGMKKSLSKKKMLSHIQTWFDERKESYERTQFGEPVPTKIPNGPVLLDIPHTGTHLSSNLDSLEAGFAKRDPQLGISIARTLGEEQTSPTLGEPKGREGRVHVTVTGKGLDYSNPEHREFIDSVSEQDTRNVVPNLRKMGVDWVDGWNSIGADTELHVLNPSAIKIDRVEPGKLRDLLAENRLGERTQEEVPPVAKKGLGQKAQPVSEQEAGEGAKAPSVALKPVPELLPTQPKPELTPAQRQIVDENAGLAQDVAAKLGRKLGWKDVQDELPGLADDALVMLAVEGKLEEPSYDPQRGKFKNYLLEILTNRIKSLASKERKARVGQLPPGAAEQIPAAPKGPPRVEKAERAAEAEAAIRQERPDLVPGLDALKTKASGKSYAQQARESLPDDATKKDVETKSKQLGQSAKKTAKAVASITEGAAGKAVGAWTEAERAAQEAEAIHPVLQTYGAGPMAGMMLGPATRSDVLGGKGEIPKAPTPEMQERLDAAYGAQPTPFLQKARELWAEAWRKLTRHFEYLPKTPEFVLADETLRNLQDVGTYSHDQAIRNVARIIHGLGAKKQFKLFETAITAGDMLHGPDWMAFGAESKQQVAGWKAEIDDVVAQTPAVAKALETRQPVVTELVDALKKEKLLPEETDPSDYYHREVFAYRVLQARLARGAGIRAKKRGFQKARVERTGERGPEFDYNTSYVESEVAWMTQAHIELTKARLRKQLAPYDRLAQLQADAKANETTWEQELKKHPELKAFYWKPGHPLYPATTIPDKIVERLRQGIIEEATITEDDLHQVLALGRRQNPVVFPVELVQQLNALKSPDPVGPVGKFTEGMMKSWKAWVTSISPKRTVAYGVKNLLGDWDPILAAAPGINKPQYLGRAVHELWNYYYHQQLPLSPDLTRARDNGVIDSGFTSQEVEDIRKLPVFRRLLTRQRGELSVPQKALDLAQAGVAGYSETLRTAHKYREALLRYAAFLYYNDMLGQGKLTHYGVCKKGVIDALQKQLGTPVAAARMARQLVGDYGNRTVFGDWLRRHAYPFWAFPEMNIQRYPALVREAFRSGERRSLGRIGFGAGKVLGVALLLRIGTLYALRWLWNNLFHRDEEEKLSATERSSPHITIGTNPDGSVMRFVDAGSLGDFLEWFGGDDVPRLIGQYRNEQITLGRLLAEFAKTPANKAWSGIAPWWKAFGEVPAGVSTFPDVFNPRTEDRGRLVAGIGGLQDEYTWAKGMILDDGSRPRPHYFQRWMFGVSDAQKSALHEIYDLRERFLQKKGIDTSGRYPISRFANARYAAQNADYDAFLEWRRAYIKQEKAPSPALAKFNGFLGRLDPISARLSDSDEREFEQEFLNYDQRQKLKIARDYAQELKSLLSLWWNTAEQGFVASGTP